jgi:hypothetical protein
MGPEDKPTNSNGWKHGNRKRSAVSPIYMYVSLLVNLCDVCSTMANDSVANFVVGGKQVGKRKGRGGRMYSAKGSVG